MEKYVLNKQSGVLHRENCGHAKDIFHYEGSFLLDELFSVYEEKARCCPCLNKDKKAQEFVENHNKTRRRGNGKHR